MQILRKDDYLHVISTTPAIFANFVTSSFNATTNNSRSSFVVDFPSVTRKLPKATFVSSPQAISTCEGSRLPDVHAEPDEVSNPFSESLNIEFNRENNEPFSYFIYDLLGNLVRQQENIAVNKLSINKAELNNGVYFIELKSGGQSINRKIIVE